MVARYPRTGCFLPLAAGLGTVLLYLMVWPVRIDPAGWRPLPPPPFSGQFAVNAALARFERIGLGDGVGPEDVAVDSAGRIYAGVADGRILRLGSTGSEPQVFATTGGRPLGMHFDRAGNLLVADAERGLVSVSPAGAVTALVTEHGNRPFRLTDDVEVAPDGRVYFSDASWKFPLADYQLDLLEHRPHGRLLAFDPATGRTRLVLDSLYFANGVAVSRDGTFVLVVETGAYRVRRVWLRGPRAGRHEVFIDDLPAFPDGISSGEGGLFWLALPSPRLPLMDQRLLPYPFLAKVAARLPAALRPGPRRYGFVLGLDRDGRVVHNLQDPAGGFAQITSVQEHGGMLYLGSLVERAVARVPVPGTATSR